MFRPLYWPSSGCTPPFYHRAYKSLARPGRKQARKHVRDSRDFNNIETGAVIKFIFFLQGKARKEIYANLTETLAYPNILLNTMFSYTISFLSSRNVNDQVSHPYKTTGKIVIINKKLM